MDGDGSSLPHPRDAAGPDIVGSRANRSTPPSFQLCRRPEPGLRRVQDPLQNRATVVCVGANDIVHAFNGTMGNRCPGKIFSYIPQRCSSARQQPSTPAVDGPALLDDLDMDHHFWRTQRRPISTSTSLAALERLDTSAAAAPDWHSIPVGGLGKGGRAYYALDITNPAAITAASQRRARLRLHRRCCGSSPTRAWASTYGEPVFVKTRKVRLDGDPAVGLHARRRQRLHLSSSTMRTGALLEAGLDAQRLPSTVDTGLAHQCLRARLHGRLRRCGLRRGSERKPLAFRHRWRPRAPILTRS